MVFMAARCRWLLVAKREQSSKTFDTFAKFTTLAAPATPLPASDCTILQRKLFMLILIIFICQPLVAATHSPTTSANKMERKQDRTAQDSSVCFVRRWIAE